jgi:hypothetical protein
MPKLLPKLFKKRLIIFLEKILVTEMRFRVPMGLPGGAKENAPAARPGLESGKARTLRGRPQKGRHIEAL